MLAFTLLSLASATASLAMPMMGKRQQSQCIAAGSFASQSNFLLTALNSTTPVNYTDPGAVLQTVQTGQDGSVSHAFLEYANPASTSFQTFSLKNGTLIPSFEDPAAPIGAVDLDVSAGQPLSFESSAYGTGLPAAAEIYCGQADIDPVAGYLYSELQIHGNDAYSMCSNGTRTVVVWQAAADNGGVYDFASCYPVRLQITTVNGTP
ncbi:hypothetical protein B0H21DRAFT_823668 [Amylocystis lapponica]|nr:hypothetical protein B0H21DRAFT_823668 [Amylocystis lapponica]